MAYFANYAFWNYLTLPALLLREDIGWKEIEPGFLEAEFPPSLPTHCRLQQFVFDRGTGRLVQHNYTADIISRYARAANVVGEHGARNGLIYPCRRRVTPRRKNGKPFEGPVLIDIFVHEFHLST